MAVSQIGTVWLVVMTNVHKDAFAMLNFNARCCLPVDINQWKYWNVEYAGLCSATGRKVYPGGEGCRRPGQLNRLSEGTTSDILTADVLLTDTILGNIAHLYWFNQSSFIVFPIGTILSTIIYSQSFIYSPTDSLVSCLKNNIKIYIKTASTCFGVTVTPSSGSALICAY